MYTNYRLNSSTPVEMLIENINPQLETQPQSRENMQDLMLRNNPAYESNTPKNCQSNKQFQHTLEPNYETISLSTSQLDCKAKNEQEDQYDVLDQSKPVNDIPIGGVSMEDDGKEHEYSKLQ